MTTANKHRTRIIARLLPGASLAVRESEPRYPPHSILRKVWQNGITGHRKMALIVGRRFAGATVRLVEVGELIHVYYGQELIGTVVPDPERRYQTMSKRAGRRR